ncbi:MAG: energy-coupling factor ABC transporter ATP-binding protein [Proteobacteria bacterium]|nr:energy-coupling factor ABC transporter ATP-binding protein [Pseudomonadota bacterium]
MTEPLFRLEDIHYGYQPDHLVLNGANFQLNSGDKTALTGPNGAGKTTLFHLMVGLITPLQGEIFAFGKPRTRESDFLEVRSKAGILFQDSDDQLFCPTVREDIAFGPLNLGKSKEEANAIVIRTLEQLGMQGFESRITHHLSGGEKRLISLATVLAMEPKVLLLDEPTNGLDQNAEKRLLEILLTLPQTMVIISHQADFLEKVTTQHACLENGQIRSDGKATGRNLQSTQ